MRKIAFVGTAKGEMEAPFKDESFEIWCMNWNTPSYPRVTLDFEIHTQRKGKKVVPLKHNNPTISQDNFPHEWIEKNLPRYLNNYFYKSSLDYMAAYALYQHKTAKTKADKIELVSIHGVHMSLDDDEYFKQQPSFNAWIASMLWHFDVIIDEHSPLMKSTFVYGLGEQIAMDSIYNRQSFKKLAGAHRQAMQNLDNQIKELQNRRTQQDGSAQIWELLDKIGRAVESGQKITSLEDLVKIYQ